MTNEALKKIIKSFVPANENKPGEPNTCCPRVTIVARDKGQVAIGRSKTIRGFIIFPLLGISAVVVLFLILWGNAPITVNMADKVSETISSVAKCEGKHANTIHNEMKAKYGYSVYTKIGIVQYHRIMKELLPRANCNMDFPK